MEALLTKERFWAWREEQPAAASIFLGWLFGVVGQARGWDLHAPPEERFRDFWPQSVRLGEGYIEVEEAVPVSASALTVGDRDVMAGPGLVVFANRYATPGPPPAWPGLGALQHEERV